MYIYYFYPPGSDKKRQASQQAAQLAYLEQNPYDDFSAEQLREANTCLSKEMEIVKQGMAHGELSIDAYSQVWEECLAQVCSFDYYSTYSIPLLLIIVKINYTAFLWPPIFSFPLYVFTL